MAPPSCKRCRVHEASEDLEHLISWASAANLRAGWELYSKLRVYGLSPSASALEMHPKCSSPVLPHFDTASTIVKESILKTLQRRRVSRAKRGEDIPPEEAEVPPLRAVSNWSSLPVDVALQIVTHLESQHLHKAACISTMYKDVIGCVISSLSFCCYDHSNKEVNSVVRGASTIFHCLETVSLRRNPTLADSSVCMLLSANSRKLRCLDLSGCSILSDVTLGHIALHCRGLHCLDVSSCTKMTNSAFVMLAKACPDLRSVNACGCELLSDTGVMALSIHCNKLCEVNLGWCHQVSDFGVCSLARGCPGLQAVDLCGCHLIGDQSVSDLARGCPTLHSLGLHCLRHLTDASMLCMAQCLQSLKSLNVSGCTLLSVNAVQAVLACNPGLHTCARRRSVIVSGCMGLVGIQCTCHRGPEWIA